MLQSAIANPCKLEEIVETMLVLTKKGLYCPAGDFYIDPMGAVDTAIVTHAHADHARRGSQNYFCARSGLGLLKARLGGKINARGLEYGEVRRFGSVDVSLHSAGHILGSAQVRMDFGHEVWVASGDYKRTADPTCEPFESVSCDVFVTEATFGTPAFDWPDTAGLGAEIATWWSQNSKQGMNSVLFGYSLGKMQRILGVLEPFAQKPIYCHPAARALNQYYRLEGIALAPTICLSEVPEDKVLTGELVLVPPAFLKSPQAAVLGSAYQTAFASGWMAKSNGGFGPRYDRGFVMSDHADWKDLVRTVLESRARKVYVQHRGQGALVRHLRHLGIQAFPDSELAGEAAAQMTLF